MNSKKLGIIIIFISVILSFYFFSISAWNTKISFSSNIRYAKVAMICTKTYHEGDYDNGDKYCSLSPSLASLLVPLFAFSFIGYLLYNGTIEQKTIDSIINKIKSI